MSLQNNNQKQKLYQNLLPTGDEAPPAYNPHAASAPELSAIANINYNQQQIIKKQPYCKQHKKCIIICLLIMLLGGITYAILQFVVPLFANQRQDDTNTSICIWNSTDSSLVNGLYSSYNKISQSGYPMYSMDMEEGCNVGDKLYVFNSIASAWTISSAEDNISSIEIRGVCALNTENLTKCVGKWMIPVGQLQKEVSAAVAKKCPQITCSRLDMIYDQYLPQERCSGPLKQNTKLPNLYQKGISNVYLYFNTHLFRWICGDINIITQQCINVSLDTDGIYGYAMKQSWFNANSLLDNDKMTMEWSNTYNLSISCSSPTASPTKSPTKSPSKSPTKSPTHSPTNSPTKSPTPSPTKSPIQDNECFASDSYVFTYPDYARKQMDDLKINDKILSYDELKDEYIWQEILIKIHSDENDYLFHELVPMIQFTLSNNQTLSMTKTHLLFVYNTNNGLLSLKKADTVVIGDILKQFNYNGSEDIYCTVIFIENVMKFPRNVITYNGNLIINSIVISSWTDTIWGENKYFGKVSRFVIKHVYSYNIWRYTCYFFSILWNDYLSVNFKQTIHKFRFPDLLSKNNCESRFTLFFANYLSD